MPSDVQREFQILAQENPRSPVVMELLRQIRSWQRRW